MPVKFLLLIVVACLVAQAQPPPLQNVNRVLFFPQAASPSDLQAIANMIHVTADIQDPAIDNEKKSVTVKGTSEQIALAEWLGSQLNKPANTLPPREYRMPFGNPQPVVRIYYLTQGQTPADMQDITNIARSLADLQRFISCVPRHAIVMRGTADQAALVDWLIHDLDRSAAGPSAHEYRMPGGGQVARVFYLAHTESPEAMREMTNLTRFVGDIQCLFPYRTRKALVARGSAEQVAAAAWLIQGLDQPASAARSADPSPHEFRMLDRFSPLVRMFSLTRQGTPQSLQEMVTALRQTMKMQFVFSYASLHALAVRGTADRVPRTGQWIKESDKP